MKFFLIGDQETVLGFSLAGVEGEVAQSKAEILTILRQIKHRSDIGIIIITERLAERVRPFLKSMLLSKVGPLILEIPDSQGPLDRKNSAEALVVSALGMQI